MIFFLLKYIYTFVTKRLKRKNNTGIPQNFSFVGKRSKPGAVSEICLEIS